MSAEVLSIRYTTWKGTSMGCVMIAMNSTPILRECLASITLSQSDGAGMLLTIMQRYSIMKHDSIRGSPM
ncbi:hypothetical protein SSSM5_084 [Synechococcus phage S-SSM5]|uniref:Uncharacterized protein n=1 Tax=Synechococcus phage S-SSM5 TaxID=445685 RepID=E3SKC4_9CAUD|nr:hypothetical protein SSSM5_084 [Synechococcus phage S-SSM5]ADO97986.1 hypothetical protein SSSM5_084 [Synechococcus phage S-SSM5]